MMHRLPRRAGAFAAVAALAAGLVFALPYSAAEAQTKARTTAAAPRDVAKRPVAAQRGRPAARPAARQPARPVYVPPPPAIDLAETYVAPSGLPTVLGGSDVALYRRIFAAQASGDLATADADIGQVRDRVLMGYVLAQRYLTPGFAAGYEDLAAWLRDNNDLPDAPAIYRLAVSRRTGGAEEPTPATVARATYSPTFAAARTLGDGNAVALRGQLERMLSDGGYNAARALLDQPSTRATLGEGEVEHWRGRVATATLNDPDRGTLPMPADTVGDGVPRDNWTAGIAAWRKGDYGTAAARFSAVADARVDQANSWMLAAGAFWAARSYAQAGQPAQFIPYMKRAAIHERTFYGLLALRTLGVEPVIEWRLAPLDRDGIERLRGDRAARRALALLQLGQANAAGRELYAASIDRDVRFVGVVLALAEAARLPAVSQRVANAAWDERRSITGFDGANYPVPPWQPPEGYTIDRALVFAIMRQESAFDPKARSRAGAMGLMQVMPGTAGFMTRTMAPEHAGASLLDPGVSLSLGQQYVQHLLDTVAGGDLVRMAAGYNGGPGNVARWDSGGAHGSDPLLWIASIPLHETRDYVERVMANYWLYRIRFGQKNPSLDQLAANQWPRYAAQDRR
jgi:soluble lytic murein transglycosylase